MSRPTRLRASHRASSPPSPDLRALLAATVRASSRRVRRRASDAVVIAGAVLLIAVGAALATRVMVDVALLPP